MLLWHYELSTPLGPMRAGFDGRGRLRELILEAPNPRQTTPLPPQEQREAKHFLDRQVAAFLAGTLQTFTVPIDPQGTAQAVRIWDAVRTIPYGQSREPRELAAWLGLEEAPVVMACAANPILLLIPAHRVVLPGEGPIPRALRQLEAGAVWQKP